MTLACVDGGLLCGPLLILGIGSLLAWIGCKAGTCDHDH